MWTPHRLLSLTLDQIRHLFASSVIHRAERVTHVLGSVRTDADDIGTVPGRTVVGDNTSANREEHEPLWDQ